MDGDADAVLAGLDDDQRAAALAVRGPVLILAGAGSGKTRAITHRIAYAVRSGIADPRHGLAVTFTTRAAGEMRGRLAALGVERFAIDTFHAAALRQLRHFWPISVGGAFPRIVPAKTAVLGSVLSELGLPRGPQVIKDLAAEIEWAKSNMVAPDRYAAAAERTPRTLPEGFTAADAAGAYQQYAEAMAEQGLIDFDDVLLLLVGVLQDRPDVAESVRSRYRWFTVDEYQDVSRLQQSVLDLWLGDRDDICVVGDPAQTIYGFAGASERFLLEFRLRHPAATVVRLARTYRCTPQIVSAANALMAGSPRSMTSSPGSGQSPTGAGVPLRSQQPDGPSVSIMGMPDDVAEARQIAEDVRSMLAAGVPAGEIAVLVRANAAAEPIETALSEAVIPYRVRGGERFFDRPEVREAITRFRGAAATSRSTPAGPVDAVQECLVAMGFDRADAPQGRSERRERWESLLALSDTARAFLANGGGSLTDLVVELERRAQHQDAPAAEAVTIATLHSAKGLEWDAVFIMGLSEGTLPISYARTPSAVEEERRLLYVGITRARRHLQLSWPRARPDGTPRQQSRFLTDIAQAAAAATPIAGDVGSDTGSTILPSPSATSRHAAAPHPVPNPGWSHEHGGPRATRRSLRPPRRCRVCGAALVSGRERTLHRCDRCPSTLDAETYTALLDWRSAVAEATGQPVGMVVTEVTLRAIAELQPANLDELGEIDGMRSERMGSYGAQILELVARDSATPSP